MKYFCLIGLVVILLFGSGIGGYFIGKGINDEEKTNITNEQVIAVLDKLCYSTGWIDENKDNSIKTLSNNEQNYEEDYMDFNGQEDFIKAYIYISKFILLNEEIEPSKYYISTASYKHNDNQYSASMGLNYEFGINCAYINIFDFNSKTNVTIIIDIAPIESNSYQINILMDKYVYGSEGITLQQINLDQYANEIHSYSMFTMETSHKNLLDISINDVLNMNLYGCDLINNKKINIYKNEIINEQTYTFNALIGKLKEQTNKIQGIAFGSRIYTEVNILEEVYINLGYEII